MTYSINELGKKRLTDFLYNIGCDVEGMTFNTPQDAHDVCVALQEKWHNFCVFAWGYVPGEIVIGEDVDRLPNPENVFYDSRFIFELCYDNPARTCWLVNQYLESLEEGKC